MKTLPKHGKLSTLSAAEVEWLGTEGTQGQIPNGPQKGTVNETLACHHQYYYHKEWVTLNEQLTSKKSESFFYNDCL